MVAVFLIGFGQPQSLDELRDFIERVIGRKPSDEAVRVTRARYEHIGGSSPVLDITGKQAEALKVLLEDDGVNARIFIGMRHSQPWIKDAITNAVGAGLKPAPTEFVSLSSGLEIQSKLVTRLLRGCTEVVLLSVTIGPDFDAETSRLMDEGDVAEAVMLVCIQVAGKTEELAGASSTSSPTPSTTTHPSN